MLTFNVVYNLTKTKKNNYLELVIYIHKKIRIKSLYTLKNS